MFRAQICAVMGMVVMLASTSTDAAELSLFVENRLGGTDNATQRSQLSAGGRRSDGFWHGARAIRPTVRARGYTDTIMRIIEVSVLIAGFWFYKNFTQ